MAAVSAAFMSDSSSAFAGMDKIARIARAIAGRRMSPPNCYDDNRCCYDGNKCCYDGN